MAYEIACWLFAVSFDCWCCLLVWVWVGLFDFWVLVLSLVWFLVFVFVWLLLFNFLLCLTDGWLLFDFRLCCICVVSWFLWLFAWVLLVCFGVDLIWFVGLLFCWWFWIGWYCFMLVEDRWFLLLRLCCAIAGFLLIGVFIDNWLACFLFTLPICCVCTVWLLCDLVLFCFGYFVALLWCFVVVLGNVGGLVFLVWNFVSWFVCFALFNYVLICWFLMDSVYVALFMIYWLDLLIGYFGLHWFY